MTLILDLKTTVVVMLNLNYSVLNIFFSIKDLIKKGGVKINLKDNHNPHLAVMKAYEVMKAHKIQILSMAVGMDSNSKLRSP